MNKALVDLRKKNQFTSFCFIYKWKQLGLAFVSKLMKSLYVPGYLGKENRPLTQLLQQSVENKLQLPSADAFEKKIQLKESFHFLFFLPSGDNMTSFRQS